MFQKIKRIAGIVILSCFVLALIYVMIARFTDISPNLFGYGLLRVSSESMEPELTIGDIVLVKKTDPAELKKCDVISYNGEKGPYTDKTVTHQIVEEPYEKDGLYYFTTRGIKTGCLDDPEIDETQIIGLVKCRIPIIGTLYDFFSKWYGMVALAAMVLIIFSSEIIGFVNRFRKDELENEDSIAETSEPEFGANFTETIEKEADEVIITLEDI
ncbi:MAG: signal peptidase I [Clostridia bacterium]|nr:signal peptidase I [Clostridia bacterium]